MCADRVGTYQFYLFWGHMLPCFWHIAEESFLVVIWGVHRQCWRSNPLHLHVWPMSCLLFHLSSSWRLTFIILLWLINGGRVEVEDRGGRLDIDEGFGIWSVRRPSKCRWSCLCFIQLIQWLMFCLSSVIKKEAEFNCLTDNATSFHKTVYLIILCSLILHKVQQVWQKILNDTSHDQQRGWQLTTNSGISKQGIFIYSGR